MGICNYFINKYNESKESIMKIAISTDNGNVSSHFGRCPEFTFLKIEDKKLVSGNTVLNPGHHSGFLPQFLKENGIDCIVAGGMGMRARELFNENGIKTILGVEGSIEEITKKLLKETLEDGKNICQSGAGKGYGIDKTECEHQ
jgi:predicted Fe-Mo cluster-binding NifX family protein